MGARGAAALATLLVVGIGCPGEGTGLDPFGKPLTDAVPLGPTLAAIQANIFTAICTQCHTGSAAPEGMALDAGVARQNIVGVPSNQIPGLLRVNPGKPDSSYIVWKIEGRDGIGGLRMPRNLPPLSADQIAAIRQWIENGAEDN